jgi:hypothetical protein
LFGHAKYVVADGTGTDDGFDVPDNFAADSLAVDGFETRG